MNTFEKDHIENTYTDKYIHKMYDMIVNRWKTPIKNRESLEKQGVKLPNLYKNGSDYNQKALALIIVTENYPYTKAVSKNQVEDIIEYLTSYKPDAQALRHLSNQDGWAIHSGKRGDIYTEEQKIRLKLPNNATLKSGWFHLISLTEKYSGSITDRKKETTNENFETIKKNFNNECAICGSKEGEPNKKNTNTKTKLEKGHINPNKSAIDDNIQPHCQICNQYHKSDFIFDEFGRVKSITNPKRIFKYTTLEQKLELFNLIRNDKEVIDYQRDNILNE